MAKIGRSPRKGRHQRVIDNQSLRRNGLGVVRHRENWVKTPGEKLPHTIANPRTFSPTPDARENKSVGVRVHTSRPKRLERTLNPPPPPSPQTDVISRELACLVSILPTGKEY